MKIASRTGGAGKEYINALNKLYSSPSRLHILSECTSRRTCHGCGIKYRPICPTHNTCHSCWQWHRAITGILTTRQTLHEAARQ
jgi:hypothetical protein